ncbi:MAG: TAXI family TRAP transporter solute-binding subunit [Thermodesulfobacteriota bacterium]
MRKRWKAIKFAGGWGLDYREIGHVLGKRLIHHEYGIEIIEIGTDIAIMGAEIVSRGETDVGITRPPAIKWAIKGIGPYKSKMENLRAVALLPRDLTVNLAVKAETEIGSWGQLVKKRYPLKVKGTDRKMHIQGVIHSQILQEYGASFEDIEAWGGKLYTGPDGYVPEFDTADKMIKAMREGILDGIFTNSGSDLAKIARSIPLKLVTIESDVAEKLKEKYDHRIVNVLPNTLYPGQDHGFTTIMIGGLLLFTREEVDEAFVNILAKVIHENSLELASCQEGIVGLPGIGLANTWGIPLHEGARKYYRSIGWLP